MHDIAAQVAIVEDALSDHGLHNAFLHEALGLRLGIEGYNFDSPSFQLAYRPVQLPPIIRIESDETGRIGIFLDGGLGIAQRDFRFDIVV